MHILELHGVTKVYLHGRSEVAALRGIDLAIDPGEFVAIAGPSGSGKTTLLNLIGCLDTPTAGSIRLDGRELASLDANRLAYIRRREVGFVFQSYNLIPVLTAYENVELPLRLAGGLSDAEIRRRVLTMLAEVGLAGLERRRPADLSGGQQQRVAIARALVKAPKLVLADEPTANLDSENGEAVLSLMRTLNARRGVTFVFSTHDPRVMKHARRLIELRDGRIEKDERR